MRGVAPETPPWLVPVAAILGAAVLCSRFSYQLVHARLWGDEAWLFYPQAYEVGLRSLLVPDSGYLNTAQRLGALVTIWLHLPLVAVPTCFAAMALSAQLAIALYLAGPRLAGLWPDWRQRGAFALLYLALPSAYETFGNLTNIQWHFGLLAFMIVMAPPARLAVTRGLEAAALLLAGLSGPFALLLGPFCLYRVWANRRDSAARGASLWRLLLIGATACVQLGFLALGPAARHLPMPLGADFAGLARIVATRVVLSLVLGFRLASRLSVTQFWRADWPSLLLGLASCAGAVVAWLRGGVLLRSFLMFVALVFAAEMSSPVVSGTMPQWPAMYQPGGWAGQRYFMLPMLAWAGVLFTLAGRGGSVSRPVARASLAAIALVAVPLGWRYPHVPQPAFVGPARAFDAAPAGTRFEFPVLPLGSMVLVKR